MMNRLPTLLLVLALGIAVLAGGMLWYVSDHGASPADTSTQLGAAQVGGPFSLIDQNGVTRTDKDFRGKFVLLYFGYSFCPDVCPATLGVMADALPRLGAKAKRIVPVFVTIDPDRDTPGVLKKYLAAFGPEFVGLTGNADQIAKIAHEYRVYYQKAPLKGGGYSVDHSSVIYLLGPDGKFVTFFEDTLAPDELDKKLNLYL
jgi:cytochrome oxidase Cu insertion factor (SCO1/SenC/PrrC family)